MATTISTTGISTTTSSALGTTHLNTTAGGIDIDAMVSALIQADSLPVVQLQNKNAVLQAQLNDYSSIKTTLTNLQYAVNDLTYSSAFTGRKATSSDTSVVTATTSNGAANGTYTINVTNAATSTYNTSAVIANNGSYANVTGTAAFTAAQLSTGTSVSAGQFTINGKTITVNSGDSINTIVNSINASGAGVMASITSDGKVALKQNTAGAAQTITLGASDTSGFLSMAGISQSAVIAGTDSASADGSYATIAGTQALSNLNNVIDGSTIKAGSFFINNQRIDVTATDTINTIVNKINASSAGVNASINSSGILTLTQKTVGATPTITVSDSGTGFFTAAGISQSALKPGVNPVDQDTLASALPGVTKGYFSINGTFFSVDPSTDTIDSIVNKINSSTTAGVLAFYDPKAHTLSLTSQTAGAKDITLGSSSGANPTDTSNFLAQIGLVQGNQHTGSDASVTVNGVAVTPVNNQVTLNGNTFTLQGKANSTATVTVGNDIDSIVSKVQTFITQYNAAMDAVNNKINEKPDSSSSDASVGDLYSDPTLVQINNSLRSFSSATVSTQPSFMQQLSQVGITTGTAGTYDLTQTESGHLVLDESKLRSALQSNLQAVQSLFGNSLVAVNGEIVGSDASQTSYTLKNGSLSGTPTIQSIDSTGKVLITYNVVSGTPRQHVDGTITNPATQTNGYECSVNYTTGKITFAKAPNSDNSNAAKISVNYNYDISSGSNAGIFVQMNTMINNMTQVGGTIDALTGSQGALQTGMKYNNDRINDLKLRLSAEQATLYTKFQNMQTQLQLLQSQGSYLTSLFSSLSSSSSK